MTTTTTLTPSTIISDLTFANYRYNRQLSPHLTPAQWATCYPADTVEAMERRYQAELAGVVEVAIHPHTYHNYRCDRLDGCSAAFLSERYEHAGRLEARYQQEYPDALRCSGPCGREIDCVADPEAMREVGAECGECGGVLELFAINAGKE